MLKSFIRPALEWKGRESRKGEEKCFYSILKKKKVFLAEKVKLGQMGH
jgi:hypothetical protein